MTTIRADAQPATSDSFSVKTLLDLRQPAHQSPAVLSPNGQWLAWVETGVVRLQGSTERLLRHDSPDLATLKIVHTETREEYTVSIDGENAWAPAWSPDGARLAYYSNRGQGARLRIFELGSSENWTPPAGPVWSAWLRNTPVWLPDGTGVLCKMVPSGSSYAEMLEAMADRPADQRQDVGNGAVFVYDHEPDDPNPRPMPSWLAARYGGDLAVVRLDEKAVDYLLQGSIPTWWGVSPDGLFAGFVELADIRGFTAGFRVGFVELASGELRRTEPSLALSFGEAVSWSPGGHRAAFVSHGSGAHGGLLVADAADASIRKLADSRPGWSRTFEGPVWSPDASKLWFAGAGGLDAVDPVSGAVHTLDISPDVRIRTIPTSGNRGTVVDLKGRVPVVFDSTSGSGNHIGRLDIDAGDMIHVASPRGEPSFGFHSDLSGDGRLLTFRTSAADMPPEYARVDLEDASMRRITEMNGTIDTSSLDSGRLVSWSADDGDALEGGLYLPRGHLPEAPLPLIVEVYGGASARDVFGEFSVQRGALVSRGYAVFVPDIPLDGTDPVRDHVQAVVPAVRMLIERGIADSTRIGLTGHSYGGYGTVALLARTDLFSAAMASASHANLAGMFSRLSPDGIVYTQWAEFGQGRMRGTPWEVPERYLRNSVLYSMDGIKAPLLLIHGAEDLNTPAYLAGEIFTSLRRLDKRVQLAVYEGEGHWPLGWSRESQRDYWMRVLSWFDEHLDAGR